MTSLTRFPEPKRNEVNLFAKHGRMAAVPVNKLHMIGSSRATGLEGIYPEINMNRELFHAARTRDDKSVLIPVDETILKQICRTYFEDGLQSALRQAVKPDNCRRHPWLGAVAQHILKVIETGHRVKVLLRPHLQIQGVECIATYSQTRDWMKSPIRCLRWHPNCFKLAVAANDDSIRIYTDHHNPVPILKNGLQKGIACMAWRPWNQSELAVGTQTGTLIWTIENILQNASIKSQVVQLKHESYFPVTSVEWNTAGTLLATASVSTTDVLLWDIDQNRYTPIQRVGPPSAHIWWAPDSGALCISTIGKEFRVWLSTNWVSDKWTTRQGHLQSMVWSPCKEYMLFCTANDTHLYSLRLKPSYIFCGQTGQMDAVPIADLSKVDIGNGQGPMEVGGEVQSLVINKKGNVLAVSFKDTSMVSLFTVTKNNSVLNLTPIGLVNGLGDEFPSVIDFGDPTEHNVLTIGWSSGRVQYFPYKA